MKIHMLSGGTLLLFVAVMAACGGGSGSSSSSSSGEPVALEGEISHTFFPENAKGVVYLFPGEEDAEAFLSSVEVQLFLDQVEKKGYGTVVPSGPGVDPAFLQAMQEQWILEGTVPAGSPVFCVAWSGGSSFAVEAGKVLGCDGMALLGSPGTWDGSASALPTVFIAGEHDESTPSELVDPMFTTFKENRIASDFYLNETEPVTPVRLSRIPGLSIQDGAAICQGLLNASIIDGDGNLSGAPGNLSWQAALPSSYSAWETEIGEALLECRGGHVFTSDRTDEIFVFLENQVVKGAQDIWEGPELLPRMVSTTHGWQFVPEEDRPVDKDGKMASRDFYFHFPNRFKGVVWFFHGINGHPDGWFGNVNMNRVVLDAVAHGYGVVVVERDVIGGSSGWDVDDLDYLQQINLWFQSESYYDETIPHFLLGFSAGAYMAMLHGYSVNSEAIVCFGAGGLPLSAPQFGILASQLGLNYQVPVRWYIGTHDESHRLERGLDNEQTVSAMGADALFTEVMQSPLTLDRMRRIPGISEVESNQVAALLAQKGVVLNGSWLPAENWESNFSAITNAEWESVLGPGWEDLDGDVKAQVIALDAGHEVFSDRNDEVYDFFLSYLP